MTLLRRWLRVLLAPVRRSAPYEECAKWQVF